MLVIITPVRWFRVPNAGLTRNRLENWIYGPARPAGFGCLWTVKCWSDQHLAGHLGYMLTTQSVITWSQRIQLGFVGVQLGGGGGAPHIWGVPPISTKSMDSIWGGPLQFFLFFFVDVH